MTNLSGRWIGRLQGTNNGNFVLVLEQAAGTLKGELRLSDVVFGLATFEVEGEVTENQATFDLKPREHVPDVQLTPGKAKAALQTDGSLAGSWETEGQTFGGFVAVREGEDKQASEDHTAAPSGAAATAIAYEKRTSAFLKTL